MSGVATNTRANQRLPHLRVEYVMAEFLVSS
jgi:hypothetical protein